MHKKGNTLGLVRLLRAFAHCGCASIFNNNRAFDVVNISFTGTKRTLPSESFLKISFTNIKNCGRLTEFYGDMVTEKRVMCSVESVYLKVW